MFHLGAPPTVIRVASLYQIFRTASAAGSDPAGEPSRGYDPDMMRAIDAWRANAGVSAADPVPNSPPTQPSTSTGPSRITRRVLQPKQIAVKLSPLRPHFKRYVRDHAEILAPYLAVQQGALEALAGNDPELRGLLDAAEAHGRASAPLANARAGVHRGNVVPYERDAREQLDFIQTLASQTGSAHASAGTQSGFRRQQ
ncbi:unnamed protein product [Tilletia controversa]|nr:unnamed protein product [Tilletia controversa]